MSVYRYIAVSRSGRTERGFVEAASPEEGYDLLQVQGLYALSLRRTWSLVAHQAKKIPEEQLLFFLEQLAFLLNSGLTIQKALHALAKEYNAGRVQTLIVGIENRLNAGLSFADALRSSAFALPPILCDWVAIGEKDGHLTRALEHAVLYLTERRSWKEALRRQLSYPLLVVCMLFVVSGLLLFFVLPSLATAYVATHSEFNGPFTLLLQLSLLIRAQPQWLLAPLLLLVLTALTLWHLGRDHVRRMRWWDRILRLPLLRNGVIWTFYIPFARGLARLLESGVRPWEAFSMMAGQQRLLPIAADLQRCEQALLQGRTLSQALSLSAFIPELACSMIATGETSGMLPRALEASATYFEKKLNQRVGQVVRFAEPAAILFLGGLVLLLALSLFMPVFGTYDQFLN